MIDIQKEIDKKQRQVDLLLNEIKILKESLPNNNTYSLEQKLNIFTNYFKGRDDVYPYLSIDNKDSNKKYYIPACVNEWKDGICNKKMHKKCSACQYREDKPITLNVIKEHLYNNKTIGLYPLLKDNTCYFLTLDFDNKKQDANIREEVLSFAKVCDDYNVPIGIEKSRSGNGFHIWIFFETNIKASIARKLGSLLLSKTMEYVDKLDIHSFDRMFPSQDILPDEGYGNLIALPFQTEPGKYGNTLFVDRNFIKHDNQWYFLENLKKLSYLEVDTIIKNLSNNTIDLSEETYNIKANIKIKSKNNFSFPNLIDVILEDMIYIDKSCLSACVKTSFRRLATFANPKFYKNQRLRLSVYNVPMIIDCSKEDDKYLKIPRGTLEYLKILCKENNVKINVKDNRNKGIKNDFKFSGELREEQKIALQQLMKYETGILKAPTGFGKTVTCCKLIEERKTNVLIITEKLQILNQWVKSIKIFLDIDAGVLGGGKNKITNVIDVASIRSIWNKNNFNDIVKNYGMIIVDECHHLAAFTYESALNTVNAKYVYGVTATPNREDGHTPIIKMQCGDIRYEVDEKEFNRNLNLDMKVFIKNTHLEFVNKNINDYTLNEIKNFISKDVLRSEKIINDILLEYKKGKNILVVTERLEHLRYFEDKLKKSIENVFVYHGNLGKKVLQSYEEKMKKIIANKENKILIATGSCIGEGFDDSSLDIMLLTMPISSIARVTQYVGRLHRKNENKKEIIIYDYVDDNFKETRNMFLKRKKTYEKLGYEVFEDDNQMKLL